VLPQQRARTALSVRLSNDYARLGLDSECIADRHLWAGVHFCHIVAGAYTPVLAKHSKHFSLEDSLAIGVDRMQRNFGPLKQQVEEWRALQLSTASAKLLIYQAFIEEESGFPKHLARA
jgi:hypothetical protein